jgi:hypothetical protein
MQFDAERVLLNVRQSTTEDLLDRVTAYREEMEPEALRIIEAELSDRGVTAEQVEVHAEQYRCETTFPPGEVYRCSFCRRPALIQAWGWHRLWGRLPLFPRLLRYCRKHRPEGTPGPGE